MQIVFIFLGYLKKVPLWLWIVLSIAILILYQGNKIGNLQESNERLVKESAEFESGLEQAHEVIDELANGRNHLDEILTSRDGAIDDLIDEAKKLKRRIHNDETIQVDSCYNSDMPDKLYYELWKQEATENNN